MPSSPSRGQSKQLCRSCKTKKLQNEQNFHRGGDGKFGATCLKCLERVKKRRNAENPNKENTAPQNAVSPLDNKSVENSEPDENVDGLSVLELDQFLAAISKDRITTFVSLVNTATIDMCGRERADHLAKAIWECMDYRFV